ncbi:hypothetical protein V8G54_021049 [Vigna mungo]|uniref:Uncharacterized protein n=1 Tax=Vigna mungo TaxID=3915 RepID=A0AAQ3NGN7_VIGMU
MHQQQSSTSKRTQNMHPFTSTPSFVYTHEYGYTIYMEGQNTTHAKHISTLYSMQNINQVIPHTTHISSYTPYKTYIKLYPIQNIYESYTPYNTYIKLYPIQNIYQTIPHTKHI